VIVARVEPLFHLDNAGAIFDLVLRECGLLVDFQNIPDDFHLLFPECQNTELSKNSSIPINIFSLKLNDLMELGAIDFPGIVGMVLSGGLELTDSNRKQGLPVLIPFTFTARWRNLTRASLHKPPAITSFDIRHDGYRVFEEKKRKKVNLP
jgi:hypothetical protein